MRRKYAIDLPFSLSLFMVFVLCAFMILLLQVNGYHRIVQDGYALEDIHTPLAYIKTSIRSNHASNAISTFQEGEMKGLKLQGEHDVRYIYEDEGYIKELRVVDSIQPDFSTGTKLFEVHAFDVRITDQVVHLSIVDKQDQKQSLQVRLQTD